MRAARCRDEVLALRALVHQSNLLRVLSWPVPKVSLVTVTVGDCLDVMRTLDADSLDALVTDPPAGIGFMGKAWDRDKGGREQWIAWLADVMGEALRVLKPGAHGLVWALPRTSHWTGAALEAAGFEVRDCLTHMFGSGFPKSLDVSKAIDRAAGAEREKVGAVQRTGPTHCPEAFGRDGIKPAGMPSLVYDITTPATDAAKQWDGWGTSLKPAGEKWFWVRKPMRVLDMCAMLLDEVDTLCSEIAKLAGPTSEPFRVPSSAGRVDSVPMPVPIQAGGDPVPAIPIGEVADLLGVMDTSPSESRATIAWNIAWSWRSTLADICKAASMSTTETATGLTTELRTLSLCLAQITPASIIQVESSPSGGPSSAAIVSNLLSALHQRCDAIRTLFAPSNVTEPAASLAESTRKLLPPASEMSGADFAGDHDHIWLVRKPFRGTVAANVQQHGCGALNIGGCRVPSAESTKRPLGSVSMWGTDAGDAVGGSDAGRFPPNVLLSHHPDCGDQCEADCPVRMLDEQSGERPSGIAVTRNGGGRKIWGARNTDGPMTDSGYSDSGGASRFLPRFRYSPKPSRAEREAGCGDMATQEPRAQYGDGLNTATKVRTDQQATEGVSRTLRANTHPTVKGVDLMRWLCRLITPPGGTVLDPFCGSGSTGCACKVEGFGFVGIEQSEEYATIARARIAAWRRGKGEPLGNDAKPSDERQGRLW